MGFLTEHAWKPVRLIPPGTKNSSCRNIATGMAMSGTIINNPQVKPAGFIPIIT